jgi:hypothetical protein
VDGGFLEVKSGPTCSGMSTENLQLHQLITCPWWLLEKLMLRGEHPKESPKVEGGPSSRYHWAHQSTCC